MRSQIEICAHVVGGDQVSDDVAVVGCVEPHARIVVRQLIAENLIIVREVEVDPIGVGPNPAVLYQIGRCEVKDDTDPVTRYIAILHCCVLHIAEEDPRLRSPAYLHVADHEIAVRAVHADPVAAVAGIDVPASDDVRIVERSHPGDDTVLGGKLVVVADDDRRMIGQYGICSTQHTNQRDKQTGDTQ